MLDGPALSVRRHVVFLNTTNSSFIHDLSRLRRSIVICRHCRRQALCACIKRTVLLACHLPCRDYCPFVPLNFPLPVSDTITSSYWTTSVIKLSGVFPKQEIALWHFKLTLTKIQKDGMGFIQPNGPNNVGRRQKSILAFTTIYTQSECEHLQLN